MCKITRRRCQGCTMYYAGCIIVAFSHVFTNKNRNKNVGLSLVDYVLSLKFYLFTRFGTQPSMHKIA